MMNAFCKTWTLLLPMILSNFTLADELYSIGFGVSDSSWGVVSKSVLDLHGVPKSAIERMKKILGDGGSIRGIGFTPSGGWGVTYVPMGADTIHWSASQVPEGAVDYMNKRTQEGAEILDMAFGPNNSWFVLTRKDGALRWQYKGVPDDLANYLETLSGGDRMLNGVGMTSQSGWAVISKSKSGVFSTRYKGIPQAAANKVQAIIDMKNEAPPRPEAQFKFD